MKNYDCYKNDYELDLDFEMFISEEDPQYTLDPEEQMEKLNDPAVELENKKQPPSAKEDC